MQCSNLLMRACIKRSGFKFSSVVKITGVPQGCVLSLILLSLFICKNEITCNRNRLTLIKYADDIGDLLDIWALLVHIEAVCRNHRSLVSGEFRGAFKKNLKELCCRARWAYYYPASWRGRWWNRSMFCFFFPGHWNLPIPVLLTT